MTASREAPVFGLFSPTCPVELVEKAWIERRMRWLADRFGADRMRSTTIVLPTDEFFPDHYQSDEASARRCLDRVCRHMRVDPASLRLTVLPDEAMPGAAGLYQRGVRPRPAAPRPAADVFVAVSQLANPMALIATLAHEVGHEILLGGGHLTDQVTDHEQVTDLLTVFLGLGVFNANATLHESSWRDGNTSGWSIGRQGYLSAAAFGYAFGVLAYARCETNPAWARHLRPDARGAMRKGQRYLSKTNDCLFRPGDDTPHAPTPTQVIADLAHRSATFRLGALWDVPWAGATGPDVVAAVTRCLTDREGAVRFEAARVLGTFGEVASGAVPGLLDLVRHEDSAWPAAITALASIRADADVVVPEVISLLRTHQDHAATLARVVKSYGTAAQRAVPALLDAVAVQFTHGGREVQYVLDAIRDLSPNPEALVRAHFATDPELQRLALWELRQLGR